MESRGGGQDGGGWEDWPKGIYVGPVDADSSVARAWAGGMGGGGQRWAREAEKKEWRTSLNCALWKLQGNHCASRAWIEFQKTEM